MSTLELQTPDEIAASLGARVRHRRLALSLTQAGLAARAGVSLGTLKRFEQTGQIALVTLLKVAFVLDALEPFNELFSPASYASLDDVLAANKPARRRGTRF